MFYKRHSLVVEHWSSKPFTWVRFLLSLIKLKIKNKFKLKIKNKFKLKIKNKFKLKIKLNYIRQRRLFKKYLKIDNLFFSFKKIKLISTFERNKHNFNDLNLQLFFNYNNFFIFTEKSKLSLFQKKNNKYHNLIQRFISALIASNMVYFNFLTYFNFINKHYSNFFFYNFINKTVNFNSSQFLTNLTKKNSYQYFYLSKNLLIENRPLKLFSKQKKYKSIFLKFIQFSQIFIKKSKKKNTIRHLFKISISRIIDKFLTFVDSSFPNFFLNKVFFKKTLIKFTKLNNSNVKIINMFFKINNFFKIFNKNKIKLTFSPKIIKKNKFIQKLGNYNIKQSYLNHKFSVLFNLNKIEIFFFIFSRPFFFKKLWIENSFFLKKNTLSFLNFPNFFEKIFNNFFYLNHSFYKFNNVVPSKQFYFFFYKHIIKVNVSTKFSPITTVWHYHALIRFLEFCSGKKTLFKVHSFIHNQLTFYEKLNCSLWSQRLKYFKKMLGPRLFLSESLQIIYTALKLKDPYLLSNWIINMMSKISFWKHKLFLRYIRYVLKNFFWPNFESLNINGIKFQLKGKISVAGNSRTRTVFMYVGSTSHSNFSNKILYKLSLVKTFTGVMGFKLWMVF